MDVLAAVAAWGLTSACQYQPLLPWLNRICPLDAVNFHALEGTLSPSAKIYFPGSAEYAQLTTRWSTLEEPRVDVVVVPGTEDDVSHTVTFANTENIPFLAYNGGHGATTTLGKMDHGIAISLSQLNSIKITDNGETATVGGGVMSNDVVDKLWAHGKLTGKLIYLGPGLGGGHGWLQGHYGLISDQFVSMNVVLADGTLTQLDANSDLWWAMKGAGHNFGIVTSVKTKIYDVRHRDWAIETFVFGGDKVEDVYEAANKYILRHGRQPVDVINWSYWLNDPQIDPGNVSACSLKLARLRFSPLASQPVILFFIIQEGSHHVDPMYTTPFHNLGPLAVQMNPGTYLDLAAWTGIAKSSPPCQKSGNANPRFPMYLDSYDVMAQTTAYAMFADATRGVSVFNNSIFMFEGYSTHGVKSIASDSSAFAFRDQNILAAPLISYAPVSSERGVQAAELGNRLRQALLESNGDRSLAAYVNYAYGNEALADLFGHDERRLTRLRELKGKYDPLGRFGFFAPIPRPGA
ncbi:hypothetical protein N7492_004176 [Penicillium capsulatum]|uniref:FAD-binding PCMH-type domain-containing protein n=1 Tax=Penicillium capsulatum TaxID=69766 RepID=A0A9W9IPE9_9EURO|nr:hypothetical protein N7492_004176 [Penicillium capsulatum]KAJ6121254.1 hypothetical protein N7512_003719 [Penicillium capsulatum]